MIKSIIQSLIKNDIIPETGTFKITKNVITGYIFEYSKLNSGCTNPLKKPSNLRYAEKLAYLNLNKELNSRRTLIPSLSKSKNFDNSGFLYIIKNPAFPDHFKVGITKDINKRLSSYQTCDPNRKFYVDNYFFEEDCKKTERYLLENFSLDAGLGEWVHIRHYNKVIDKIIHR